MIFSQLSWFACQRKNGGQRKRETLLLQTCVLSDLWRGQPCPPAHPGDDGLRCLAETLA